MPLFHTRRCHSYTCFFHVPSIPTLPNNRRQPHSTICPPHITIRLTNMQCKLVVLCPVIHAYSCRDSQPAAAHMIATLWSSYLANNHHHKPNQPQPQTTTGTENYFLLPPIVQYATQRHAQFNHCQLTNQADTAELAN